MHPRVFSPSLFLSIWFESLPAAMCRCMLLCLLHSRYVVRMRMYSFCIAFYFSRIAHGSFVLILIIFIMKGDSLYFFHRPFSFTSAHISFKDSYLCAYFRVVFILRWKNINMKKQKKMYFCRSFVSDGWWGEWLSERINVKSGIWSWPWWNERLHHRMLVAPSWSGKNVVHDLR